MLCVNATWLFQTSLFFSNQNAKPPEYFSPPHFTKTWPAKELFTQRLKHIWDLFKFKEMPNHSIFLLLPPPLHPPLSLCVSLILCLSSTLFLSPSLILYLSPLSLSHFLIPLLIDGDVKYLNTLCCSGTMQSNRWAGPAQPPMYANLHTKQPRMFSI